MGLRGFPLTRQVIIQKMARTARSAFNQALNHQILAISPIGPIASLPWNLICMSYNNALPVGSFRLRVGQDHSPYRTNTQVHLRPRPLQPITLPSLPPCKHQLNPITICLLRIAKPSYDDERRGFCHPRWLHIAENA